MEACYFHNMLNKCGEVVLKWKPFVTKESKQKRLNLSASDIEKCVRKNSPMSLKNLICDCPEPCDEVKYDVNWFKRGKAKHPWQWQISMMYKSHRVTYITEIPKYSIPELLAELGGILGLLTGMSVLTVVELPICFVITIMMYLKCFK